jgi:hypothetical protein
MQTGGEFIQPSADQNSVGSSKCTTGVAVANGKNLKSENFSLFLSDTFG